MSRLGKIPIPLPKDAEVKASKEGFLQFKGPKGALELQLPPGYHLKFEESALLLERDPKLATKNGAEYGLYRSLVKNCVIGVATGYEVRLTMVGVGYRAAVQGDKLDLQVGFSHPTKLDIPKNVQVTVEKNTLIVVKGCDKRQVGQFAAAIRAKRPPEPYKGKGIRYEKEYVRKKEGKAAKAKA